MSLVSLIHPSFVSSRLKVITKNKDDVDVIGTITYIIIYILYVICYIIIYVIYNIYNIYNNILGHPFLIYSLWLRFYTFMSRHH